MSALTDLLNQAVQKCDPNNDAALAARLGVSRSAVSLWRKGEGIREKHLTQLIALVGADPEIAVMVLREQATTHAERAVWGALARRLGAAAAVAVVALFAANMPGGTHAHVVDSLAFLPLISSPMHIMSIAAVALGACIGIRLIAARTLPAIPVSRFTAQGAPA